MSNAKRPRPPSPAPLPRKASVPPSPVSATRIVTAPRQTSSAPTLATPPTPASPILPLAQSRERTRLVVDAAIEDAVAPLSREIKALRSRVEELEVARASDPCVSASLPVVAPPLPPSPRSTAAIAAPAAFPLPSAVISIDEELRALDGARRRHRTAAVVCLVLFVVFGSLLGAMAWSYV